MAKLMYKNTVIIICHFKFNLCVFPFFRNVMPADYDPMADCLISTDSQQLQ